MHALLFVPGNRYWHSAARITLGHCTSCLFQALSWSQRDILNLSIHWEGTQALTALMKKHYGVDICRLPPGTLLSEATTGIHSKPVSKARIWSQLTRKPRKDTQLCSCHVSTWKRGGKNIAWECCNQASLCGKQRKATEDTINRHQQCCLKSKLSLLCRFWVIKRIRRMEVCKSSLSAEVTSITAANRGTGTKQITSYDCSS